MVFVFSFDVSWCVFVGSVVVVIVSPSLEFRTRQESKMMRTPSNAQLLRMHDSY